MAMKSLIKCLILHMEREALSFLVCKLLMKILIMNPFQNLMTAFVIHNSAYLSLNTEHSEPTEYELAKKKSI